MMSNQQPSTQVSAKSGLMVVGQNGLQHKTVPLDGEWKFLWGELLPPRAFPENHQKHMQLPSVWNGFDYDELSLPATGHATFQLKVVLDHLSPHDDLALYIPFIHSSYQLFIGDEASANAGKVGVSLEDFIPSARCNLVNIPPQTDTLVLTLQVANYAYSAGGIWQSPQLGSIDAVRSYYDRQLAFDLFIMGGLLLMGLYHIALFFLRKSIKSNLYFGVLCLLLALKSLFTGTVFFYTLFPEASYELCLKMIHISLFGPVALLWLFLRELFINEFPKLIARILTVLVVLGITIVLLFPSHIYSHLMIPYLLVVAISMLFLIRGIYLAVKRKREGSILIFAGAFCFLVTVLNDMAIDLNLIKNVYLAGAGFFIFIFSQALLLAVTFTNSFKHVEKLTLEKQEILAAQKQTLEEEVARQTLELRQQKTAIEEKNREITDSITYAKRIQNAIQPQDRVVKSHLKDSFILYKPKDIIAGDFYWMEHADDTIFFAAADCTGHGVPGAMVSVICVNGLNRSVREFALTAPSQILDKTRELVIKEFEKSDENVLDGMDISLCALGPVIASKSADEADWHRELKWAGANNPLCIVRQNVTTIDDILNEFPTESNIELIGNTAFIEIQADNQPIGRYHKSSPFTNHSMTVKKGDTIYIFSDGYADQFGGQRGKKYKSAHFKRKLIEVSTADIEKQKELLDSEFESWRGDLEQVDDVCVFGVSI